ncbi:MAG: GTP-binding protein [Chthoniobacterales bacterium]
MTSVTIVAGPAARTVIDKALGNRETRPRVFEPVAGSNPGQIIEQIKTIAEDGETDHLIVQCEADTPIMAYASLFADPSGPLASLYELTTAAFAVAAATFLDSLLNRKATSISPCFLAEQLEFATDIVLDGLAQDPELPLARSIAQALNPRARIVPIAEAALISRDDAAGSLNFQKALEGAGWRKLIDEETSAIAGGSEVAAFGYRARRPFHPERFWALLQTGLPGLFRAKGFFWLATRMDEVGGLNLAGAEIQCASAGQWWAARDAHVRDSEMPERTRKEWQEPFGDRRQSFAVMAWGVNRDALQGQLNGCLLTDEEMVGGPDSWRSFVDPFPSWSAHAHAHTHEHDHECGHDHDSHDHDCCGH